MLYVKEVGQRVCVRRLTSTETFVQLAQNHAALDIRRLQHGTPTSSFLFAHAVIEQELTVILEWCTWPTLQQYAGAHATLGRTVNAQVIQLATWDLLRALEFLRQALGGPHCNVTMRSVLIEVTEVPRIKLTTFDEAGAVEESHWRRGALAYRPPEKLFGSAETYEMGEQNDTHDLFSVGICLTTLSLAGHTLDEDIPLLKRGERYNPSCKLHGETVFDLLRQDHADIRPPPGEARSLEFDHFVRMAVFMQALGNGIVPGGGDEPSLCYAVWPEFAKLPEVLAFVSVVKAQRYGGSREARIICDALYREQARMGVIRTLMQWLPRKRRRDLDTALRRWGFRDAMLQWPIVQYDASQSDIDRFTSTAEFYAAFAESGACSICGHMARLRCQRCSTGNGARLYCSERCSESDAEHRATCTR